jgi:hypothetical protein
MQFLISENLHGLKEMSRSIGRAFTNQSVVYGYTRSMKKECTSAVCESPTVSSRLQPR